jgi:hypothetical protein
LGEQVYSSPAEPDALADQQIMEKWYQLCQELSGDPWNAKSSVICAFARHFIRSRPEDRRDAERYRKILRDGTLYIENRQVVLLYKIPYDDSADTQKTLETNFSNFIGAAMAQQEPTKEKP